MKIEINNSDNYESILVYLSPEKTPIAYENRVLSLVNSGMSREDAENEATRPIEMEMYYDVDNGLFLVEAEAVGNTDIHNPYTQELLEENDEF